MYIKNISLTNFRNYEKQEIVFDKNINIFYGNNAQGKTNILESIYLCAIGKSYSAGDSCHPTLIIEKDPEITHYITGLHFKEFIELTKRSQSSEHH